MNLLSAQNRFNFSIWVISNDLMIIWEHGENPSYSVTQVPTLIHINRGPRFWENVAGAASPNNLRLHREQAASKYVHPVYRRSHKLSHLQTHSATALSWIYIVWCYFPVNVPIECWLWLYLEIDMPLIQNFLLWGFFDWTKPKQDKHWHIHLPRKIHLLF